jgi:hypothetical protein
MNNVKNRIPKEAATMKILTLFPNEAATEKILRILLPFSREDRKLILAVAEANVCSNSSAINRIKLPPAAGPATGAAMAGRRRS